MSLARQREKNANYGHFWTDEMKKRLSLLKKGTPSAFKGKHHTEEAKKKISLIHKGRRLTEEHRKKIGLALKGKPRPNQLGDKNHAKKPEIRRKISLAQTGEKNWNWQGGKSFEFYSIAWTKILKNSIRERDFYTCQDCQRPQFGVVYDVHHMDSNKKNCDPNNLITLCKSCHIKKHRNGEYGTTI